MSGRIGAKGSIIMCLCRSGRGHRQTHERFLPRNTLPAQAAVSGMGGLIIGRPTSVACLTDGLEGSLTQTRRSGLSESPHFQYMAAEVTAPHTGSASLCSWVYTVLQLSLSISVPRPMPCKDKHTSVRGGEGVPRTTLEEVGRRAKRGERRGTDRGGANPRVNQQPAVGGTPLGCHHLSVHLVFNCLLLHAFVLGVDLLHHGRGGNCPQHGRLRHPADVLGLVGLDLRALGLWRRNGDGV
mmetsp:Transcript_33852/g.95833  ORF Transcript_33852/g.95833 Transcript_33852/m.95833 type:complete len:240 (+) Transcript_33852:320-1039(+)